MRKMADLNDELKESDHEEENENESEESEEDRLGLADNWNDDEVM